MDLEPHEQQFRDAVLPEGAMPIGYIAVYAWLDNDGRMCWRSSNDCDFNVAQAIGLLEMAKNELLGVRQHVFDEDD